MLAQQLNGIFKLALPVVVMFQFYPDFVFSQVGMLACSAILGLYILFLALKAGKEMVASLRYLPTTYKEELYNLIRVCGLNPQAVTLNYAYTQERIALTTFNNIVVDPTVWSIIAEDPEAIKVKEIFTTHIEPTVSELQKTRITKTAAILSADAQRFIFKHELGHIATNYSYKNLALVGISGALAVYSALVIARAIMPLWGGAAAIIVGCAVGWLVDLALTYASNLLFKVSAERNADYFAACHSSAEECEAAARFFEQHQEILDAHQDPGSLLNYLPYGLVTGYPRGNDRAFYIRRWSAKVH